MNEYRVDYYIKPLNATRITKLGGAWGEKTEQTIMDEISSMKSHYYVESDASVAWLEIERSALGHPYLKTVPDNTRLDNLSSLPRRYS
ncbi:MAG: hypothetical protein JWP06_645 [Candidatus Saccharibacteria bacterium]|nr:hypothetical protein [Candidatus Saccharibacteria bacterium]